MSRKSPSSHRRGYSLPLAAALCALLIAAIPAGTRADNTTTATALPASPNGIPHSDLENNTKVVVSPIPEPSSLALAAGALSLALWKARRRS
jgi:hypothetical protein